MCLCLLSLQVLLSNATCCWGMTSSAKLVIIMGTQYYDGTGLGASDYPVTDLLQMLGRASRPGIDEVGCWPAHHAVLVLLRLLVLVLWYVAWQAWTPRAAACTWSRPPSCYGRVWADVYLPPGMFMA